MSSFRTPISRTLRGLVAAGLATLTLSACYMPSGGSLHEGIGYRQARFEEISAVRNYRSCRDAALELDGQARAQGDPGKYLASARMVHQCESDLGPEATNLAVEERFRAYALAVQNQVKGGDIAAAQQDLQTLKTSFPGQDLFFPDGSSFIETMELLLGFRGNGGSGEFALLNVGDELKKEMRRRQHWAHN